MTFLIAEMLGLLTVAAICGGAFVYWWTRRNLVDVSSEYERYEAALKQLDVARTSRAEAEAQIAALRTERDKVTVRLSEELEWRSELEGKLAQLKPVSLEPVLSRMGELDAAVAKIRPADLSPVESKLGAIEGAVEKIKNTDVSGLVTGVAAVTAAVAAMKPTDLSPIEARISEVDGRVAKLHNTDVSKLETSIAAVTTAVDAVQPADLAPIQTKLNEVDGRVAKLRNTDLSAIEKELSSVASLYRTDLARLETSVGSVRKAVSEIKPTDLQSVETRLTEVDRTVKGLRNADLSGVDKRVRDVTDAVARLDARIKPQPVIDLAGVHKRLDAIEKALKAQPVAQAAPRPRAQAAPRAKVARKAPRKPGGNLLKSASHGKPDDLKRISGVGPKLERMLNGIGVYYYWQVSDWNKADVDHVDDRLQVFKGRITRDGWVRQAGTLARQPGSATRNRPATRTDSSETGIALRS